MEREDNAQHPTRGKRLLVAMEPLKPLDQMTPEERRAFFGKVCDSAQEARALTGEPPTSRHA